MALDTVAARSKRRRLPSVDVPRTENEELRRSLEALKEHIRMYEGDSGAPKERFVTIEELEKAGLIGTKVQGNFALIDSVLGGDVAQGQQAGGGSGGTVIINEGDTVTGATTLAGLSDTNVAGAATNSFLQYVGGQWIGRRLFGVENTWTALNTFQNKIRIRGIDSGYVDFEHNNADLVITGSATTDINLVGLNLDFGYDQGIEWGDTRFAEVTEPVGISSVWGTDLSTDWSLVGTVYDTATLTSTGICQDTTFGIDVIDVSPDGLYVLMGNNSGDFVRSYQLASPYNFGSATSTGAAHSVTNPWYAGKWINNGNAYMLYLSSSQVLRTYNTPSAYTIDGTPGTHTSQVTGAQLGYTDATNKSAWMSADGTHLMTSSELGGSRVLRHHTLSTPYDLSTYVFQEQQVLNGVGAAPNSPIGYLQDLRISPDGLTIIAIQNSDLWIGTFGTAYDVSTITWNANNPANPGGSFWDQVMVSADANDIYFTQNTSTAPLVAKYTKVVPNPTLVDSVFILGDPTIHTEIDGSSVGFKTDTGLVWDNNAGDDIEMLAFDATAANSPDPNIASVVALFNGENATAGATTVAANIGNSTLQKTSTGVAEVSTEQAKFGTQSLKTQYTSGVNFGRWDETAKNADLDLGSSDFTLEFWVYATALSGTQYIRYDDSLTGSQRAWFLNFSLSGNMQFFTSTSGSSHTQTLSALQGVSLSSWHHIAVTRQGSTMRLFFNGALINSGTFSGTFYSGANQRLRFDNSSGLSTWWIDEFRLTKGVARYTAAFTPPTVPADDGSFIETFTVGDPAYPTQIDGTTTTITGNAQVDGTFDATGAGVFASTLAAAGVHLFEPLQATLGNFILNTDQSVTVSEDNYAFVFDFAGGQISLEQLDHTVHLSNIGTNTHAQIDTHIADATIHFTEASIDHANIQSIGTNTHAQIDTHIADTTIHFTTLDGLSDVAVATPADRHVLVYDGVTDNRWENRLLVEADISDLQSYALASHTHSLTDVTDVTATASEVNLLDLAGLTVGWALIADSATTASWQAIPSTGISGTVEGQMQYWDNTGGVWVATSDVIWNNATKDLTIRGSLANDPTTGGLQDATLFFANSSGAVAGQIYWTSRDMHLHNRVHDGNTSIRGENSSGTSVTYAEFDPGGDTILSSSSAGRMYVRYGGNTFIEGAAAVGGFRLYNASGEYVSQGQNRSSGGLIVINDLTHKSAGSFQRVLTQSDLDTARGTAMQYSWTNNITAADPGAGVMKFNNSTYSSVTEIYIDDLGWGNDNCEAQISRLASGDILIIGATADKTDFVVFSVTGAATDNTGWWTIPVSYVDGITTGLPTTTSQPVLVEIMWEQYATASVGEVIPTGTAEGNTLYWDNSGGSWVENDGLNWDEVNQRLKIGGGLYIEDQGTSTDFLNGALEPIMQHTNTDGGVLIIQESKLRMAAGGTIAFFSTASARAEIICASDNFLHFTQDSGVLGVKFDYPLQLHGATTPATTLASGKVALEVLYGYLHSRVTTGGTPSQWFSPSININSRVYRFNNPTTAADPGSQFMRANTTDLTTVTEFYFDDLDIAQQDSGPWFGRLAVGDILHVSQLLNYETHWGYYEITSITDNTGWWTVAVTHIGSGDSGAGSIYANGQGVLLEHIPQSKFTGFLANVVEDTTPQLGGNLESNAFDIILADNDMLMFGTTGAEGDMYSDGVDIYLDMNAGVDFRLRGGSANDNMIIANADGSVVLYYDNNLAFVTQPIATAGNTSTAQVYDSASNAHDIGFNTLPNFNFNASDTLESGHCGHITGKDNTTATYVLTGPADTDVDFPVGGVCQVVNLGASGVYTLNDTASCTMYYMDGSAAPVDIAGAGTLDPGGWITLWRYSTTAIYITGSGFTP